jgi:glucose-1-phosphate cytidylyltransferase
MIKSYFADYVFHNSSVTFDLANNQMQVHESCAEPWTVTLVDTGDETMTGGRLKRVRRWIQGTFCLTYGDGVGDINIAELIDFHRRERTLATVTAVRQPGRFGALALKPGEVRVQGFREKSAQDGVLINGGFFVVEPEVFDYIEGDHTVFEREPLQRLAFEGRLTAYHHHGFWQNMDTLHDKNLLEQLWATRNAPWQIWRDVNAPVLPFAAARQAQAAGGAV